MSQRIILEYEEEHDELIKTLKKDHKSESFYMVESSIETRKIVLLVSTDGTILQKWSCIQNEEDGTWTSITIYKIEVKPIPNTRQFECPDPCEPNDQNIQCYFCDIEELTITSRHD